MRRNRRRHDAAEREHAKLWGIGTESANACLSQLDFAHSIIGRVLWFQWLMWLSEAHASVLHGWAG
jgi:hypothetical protein